MGKARSAFGFKYSSVIGIIQKTMLKNYSRYAIGGSVPDDPVIISPVTQLGLYSLALQSHSRILLQYLLAQSLSLIHI